MFFTVLVSVVITLWILFCAGLYIYYYFIEEILDLPITGQSPCTAHAALKQLIQRLLQETVNLPSLNKAQERSVPVPLEAEDKNRTYEDLLATAIINKVISSYQNNLPSSSANSVSSRLSTSSRHRKEKEYFFGEETLDTKWKTTDLDTTSISSLEEWIQSDSSRGSKKYVDKVTLTIKQDIEEVYPSDSDNEEDDTEYFRTSSSLHDDEDANWFLQKRQFQGTHSPVPVPMLVPDPTTEAKVLIGDKEVAETSDLSDVGSEYEEMEPISGRHSLLIESKTVIGGKNNINIVESRDQESESSTDSGVKEVDSRVDDKIFETRCVIVPTRTDITVDDDNVEDSSIISIYSNTEKEAEYTEKYASLPRTILKTPTPPARLSLHKYDKPQNTELNENNNSASDTDDNECAIEFPGRYSKREKEKWKHAVELKNNPYSKENIEKRIKRSSSAAGSLFGPDYYAKQATSPSGGKLNPSELNDEGWPPSKHREDEDHIYHETEPTVIHSDDDVFAYPQQEDEKIEPTFQTYEVTKTTEPVITEITSESDLSYVNFYDVENSQVFRKTKDGEQLSEVKIVSEIPKSLSEGSDENSNFASEQNKHDFSIHGEKPQASTKEIPKPKPRNNISVNKGEKQQPSYIKVTTPPTPPISNHPIRRFRSESDLIDDSFDKPVRVIHKKRDNTLISKIYLDPNVRSFVLANREHSPAKETYIRPVFQKHLSVDVRPTAVRKSTKAESISSDDALLSDQESGKTGKMSFFSSEEDLLSLSPDGGNKRQESISKNNNMKSEKSESKKTHSVSSEDDILSDSSPLKSKSTKNLIYSSSEDLLSVDDVEKIPKKKDNTLISKIYLDPNVRTFALKSRDYIPEEASVKGGKTSGFSSDEEILSERKNIHRDIPPRRKTYYSSYDDLSSMEISLEHPRTEKLPIVQNIPERKTQTPDSDIDELVKKRLVRNMLGQFSKSQPSVQTRKESPDEDVVKISVRDLKKKFENNDVRGKVVSSLTARSLSKQLKDSLKE